MLFKTLLFSFFSESFNGIWFLPEVFFSFCLLGYFSFCLFLGFHQRPYNIVLQDHLRALLKLLLVGVVYLILLYLFMYGFFVVDEVLVVLGSGELSELWDLGFFSGSTYVFYMSYSDLCFRLLLSVSFFLYMLVVLPSFSYDNFYKLEIFFFLGLSFLGLLLLFVCADFLLFYLALELSSFCFYILSAMKTRDIFSAEAALKYFVLNSVSSGFLLFGLSIVYWVVGSLSFRAIGQFYHMLKWGDSAVSLSLLGRPGALFSVGILFVLVAILFKVGAVPFHFWAPDVYDGSPTFVTLYFSSVAKIAPIGFLARFFWEILVVDSNEIFFWVLICSASASILVGSVAAFFQLRLKRWVAYSGIVHIGFMLFSLALPVESSAPVFFFYLVAYLALVFSFFGIIFGVRGLAKFGQQKPQTVSDLRFLFSLSPMFSAFLALTLFSFAGIPPLIGFFSKVAIFYFLILDNYYVFGLLLLFFATLSAFYYLRLIAFTFFNSLGVSRYQQRVPYCLALVLSLFLYVNLFGYFYFYFFWVL